MRGICLTSSYLALEPYDTFIIGKWITYVVNVFCQPVGAGF